MDAGAQECGLEPLAADVGDGGENFAIGQADYVGVVATDPEAGFDAEAPAAVGEVARGGEGMLLDGLGVFEFLFDGGELEGAAAFEPGGFGVAPLGGGERGEVESVRGGIFGQ